MTTQYSKVWFISASALLVSLALAAFPAAARPADNPWHVDFRQAPVNWQTAICLPDDAQKSLVGKQGDLLYDYAGGNKFNIRISLNLAGKPDDCRQELVSPRMPIVRTIKHYGPIEVAQEAFAVGTPDRRDVLLARFVNRGTAPASVQSTLAIFSRLPLQYDKSSGRDPDWLESRPDRREADRASRAGRKKERGAFGWGRSGPSHPGKKSGWRWSSDWMATPRPWSRSTRLESCGPRPKPSDRKPISPTATSRCPTPAFRPYWIPRFATSTRPAIRTSEAVRSGSPVISVQAGNGRRTAAATQNRLLPAFQVGPTCYRGLWMVDGSFILEAVSYLGRAAEARNGIRYLLGFQRKNGQFLLMDGHWKETGIMLCGGRPARPAHRRPGLAAEHLAADRGWL